MTLIIERVNEVFWLLQNTLNISEDYKIKGIPVKTWLTPIRDDIVKAIQNNEEQAEAIFDFLLDGILYMRGDSDDCPRVELVWKL